MASEKAIYWLAVGVVALGLNSTYQQTESRWVQRLADRSVQAAEHATQRGLTLLSMAEVMLGKNPADIARLQGALARLEARQSMSSEAGQHDLAQMHRDLGQLNVELRGMRVTVPKIKCPQAKFTMEFHNPGMTVPVMADRAVVVDGTQLDLRNLESLQSLQSLESLRSLESLGSMRDLKFEYPQVPQGRVQIKIKQSSDGTI